MVRSKRRTLLAFVATMATFSVVACNSLVGISDYDRGECSGGGVCSDVDSGLVDAKADTSTIDAPIIVGDAAGSRPVSWAQFRMPNYPQDGGPSDNNDAVYTPVAGGQLDSISKRVWHVPGVGTKSWTEAQKHCTDLTEGGTWRLPSRIELVTLLDLSRSPKVVEGLAAGMEPGEYWTLSEVRLPGGGLTGEHWTVDFDKGGVGKRRIADGKVAVRCIKDQ